MTTQPFTPPFTPPDADSPQTMVYTVDLGNGHVADVEGPEGATPEQLQAAMAGHAASPDVAAPADVQMAGDGPPNPLTQMSPADADQYRTLLHTADAPTLLSFLEKRGFTSDPADMARYVAGRDQSKAAGAPVSYDFGYDLPKAVKAAVPEAFAGEQALRDHLRAGGTYGFSDELHGVASGADAFLHGGSYTDAYDRTVDQDRANLGADSQQHPYISAVGDFLGSLAVPVGLEKAGLTAGMDAIGAAAYRSARLEGFTADEARTIAQKAITRRLVGEGASYGALYGAGSADGDPGQRLLGAGKGALAGAVTGLGLGKLGERAPAIYESRVAGRTAPDATATAPSDAAAVAAAADRQGIAILPQDVGGTSIARSTQGAAQTPFGSGIIGRAANRLRDTFSGRVGELAGDAPSPIDAGNIVGSGSERAAARSSEAANATSGAVQSALAEPTDQTGAGQLIRRGISRFLDDTADRASALYDEVPIAPERSAMLNNTRRLLNDLNADWQSNPTLGAIFKNKDLGAYLKSLTPSVQQTDTGLLDAAGKPLTRDVTSGGNLSWQDLSQFRTRVGDMLADPQLSEKIAPRQLRALYGALSSDMEATARDTGPAAFAKWKRANNFYDGRMKRINDTFSMVMGQRNDATPNEAFASLQAMLKPGSTGNAAGFARIMRSLPPEDANTVRASIVNDARGGAQFDPDKFAKSWGQISERGKSALLPQAGMRVMMDDAAGRAGLATRNPFAGQSGEQIFGALDRMASSRGDAARFAATLNRLSPEEANAVRSTFIDQAGRATPGSQNADGSAFSIARWLTRWNTMTPQAKVALFGKGELHAAMTDLATVAERVKATERLAGHSNTGAVISFDRTSNSLYGAAGALMLGHPLVAAGLAAPAAYQRLSAQVLTSPRLVRWLARVPPPKASYQAQRTYLDKLPSIAVKEPALANQIYALHDLMQQAMSQSPGRAAASDYEPDRRHEPIQ